MFFELHGVGNKMWPGATSVRDELSVIIILEHGSFLSGAKTVKWGCKHPSAFQIPGPLKKKKKARICNALQVVWVQFFIFFYLTKNNLNQTTYSSIYEMRYYNNDLL